MEKPKERGASMRRSAAVALAAALLCLLVASAARAENRVYWVDNPGVVNSTDGIAFAALDGTGGGPFTPAGATVEDPTGLAIDTTGQRIYWGSFGGNKISLANLTGSGGAVFDSGQTPIEEPEGVAVDPITERIYWAGAGQKILFANLDGSGGGGELNTRGATLDAISSLAIDRSTGRVYWTNFGSSSHPVSFANLDNTGHGGDVLNTGGAGAASAVGMAIDNANGRVYWANLVNDTIGFANLNGSGSGVLKTTGAPVSEPIGVAIDPAAGLIYWANHRGDSISVADLDGSGGHQLETPGASSDGAGSPVLLVSPRATAPPQISGDSSVGSVLSCSEGTWAPDALEASLYDAPHSFSFQWSQDGADIRGATEDSLTVESTETTYRCRVTATNFAGSTSATSAPRRIPPIAFGRETGVTLTLASTRVPAKGPVAIQIANANPFAVSGELSGQPSRGSGLHQKRPPRLSAKAFTVPAEAKLTVSLSLPKVLQRLLARRHKISLDLSATVTDPSDNQRTLKQTVVEKLKAKKKKKRHAAH
jgi:hypothetical protein